VINGELRCIYCLETTGPFKKEHIISAFLGGSDALQILNSVCERCNTKTLSRLEAYQKQDSIEGTFAARYQLGRSKNVRPTPRKHILKTTYQGQPLADPDLHTVIKPDGNQEMPKQVLIRNSRNQIYKVLEGFSGKNIVKKMDDLKFSPHRMIICGFTDEERDQLYAELAALGKKWTAEPVEDIPSGEVFPVRIEEHNASIDRTHKRVILKTAFNYLAYCGLRGFANVIFSSDFSGLRSYVLQDDKEFRGGELVPTIEPQQIIFNGKILPPFSPNHLIRFYSEFQKFDGTGGVPPGLRRVLVAEVNFFSFLLYKMNLAFDVMGGLDLPGAEFGCGHIFHVLEGTWTRVDKDGKSKQPNEFSLFSNR